MKDCEQEKNSAGSRGNAKTTGTLRKFGRIDRFSEIYIL